MPTQWIQQLQKGTCVLQNISDSQWVCYICHAHSQKLNVNFRKIILCKASYWDQHEFVIYNQNVFNMFTMPQEYTSANNRHAQHYCRAKILQTGSWIHAAVLKSNYYGCSSIMKQIPIINCTCSILKITLPPNMLHNTNTSMFLVLGTSAILQRNMIHQLFNYR